MSCIKCGRKCFGIICANCKAGESFQPSLTKDILPPSPWTRGRGLTILDAKLNTISTSNGAVMSLVIAAPDLLKACKNFIDSVEQGSTSQAHYEKIKEAVLKAEMNV